MTTMVLHKDKELLIIEVFYGGSHYDLIRNFTTELNRSKKKFDLITMTPKKWHWRARCSALYLSTVIPKHHSYKALFCSSVLPLAELVGLRPDLQSLVKIVYFHENQLCYPVKVTKERDFQYGYNEILSCLTADRVMFNSKFNQTSFLSNICKHLRLQPDYVVHSVPEQVEGKCSVELFPIDIGRINRYLTEPSIKNGHQQPNTLMCPQNVLHIVWPHRWEYDKGPQLLLNILQLMKHENLKFKISILGQTFDDVPEPLKIIKDSLQEHILHFGFIEDKADYYKFLKKADVVLSTADHEFFGVSTIEAVYCGCAPVLPKKLSYVELYDDEIAHFYETVEELLNILTEMCKNKEEGKFVRKNYRNVVEPYDSASWHDRVMNIIDLEVAKKNSTNVRSEKSHYNCNIHL